MSSVKCPPVGVKNALHTSNIGIYCKMPTFTKFNRTDKVDCSALRALRDSPKEEEISDARLCKGEPLGNFRNDNSKNRT